MPPAAHLTLRDFYVTALLPLVHADASPRTLREYLTTLNVWERETTNPPLADITTLTLAEFRNQYAAKSSRETANKHLRHINHLLGKAGPPGPRNRDALGILTVAPWAKELKTFRQLPRSVSFDAIDMMYQVAGDYFRTFLVAAYNLGSRFTALINLGPNDVDWEQRHAYFAAEFDKRHIERVKPLNPIVHIHFVRLKGSGLLRWRTSLATWRRNWNRLLDKAGLDERSRFTPHDLKRTCGTQLRAAGADPWQRRYMLDHAQGDVTGESYIDPLADLDAVVARMPQPRSFQEGAKCVPQTTPTRSHSQATAGPRRPGRPTPRPCQRDESYH